MNGQPSRAFTEQQSHGLHRLLVRAETSTGLLFSVYVGATLEGSTPRAAATELLARFGDRRGRVVLVYVDPNARALEIVTGAEAGRWLDERMCGFAAVTMASSFGLGDLTGGLERGIEQLVAHVETTRAVF